MDNRRITITLDADFKSTKACLKFMEDLPMNLEELRAEAGNTIKIYPIEWEDIDMAIKREKITRIINPSIAILMQNIK